jgi:hypothetical protein
MKLGDVNLYNRSHRFCTLQLYSQVRVTAITKATGYCALQANLLFNLNNSTTNPTIHKSFIYFRTIILNLLCKQARSNIVNVWF